MDRTRTCFFTGHRAISANRYEEVKQKIREYMECLICVYDVKNFICGGALGFDTMAAEMVFELKELYPHIRLYMYLPCTNQEKLWKNDDKDKYKEILVLADEVLYVSEEGYSKECMRKRNLKMIEDAYFCIAFCIRYRSGTGFTLRSAKAAGKRIFNIADEMYE